MEPQIKISKQTVNETYGIFLTEEGEVFHFIVSQGYSAYEQSTCVIKRVQGGWTYPRIVSTSEYNSLRFSNGLEMIQKLLEIVGDLTPPEPGKRVKQRLNRRKKRQKRRSRIRPHLKGGVGNKVGVTPPLFGNFSSSSSV